MNFLNSKKLLAYFTAGVTAGALAVPSTATSASKTIEGNGTVLYVNTDVFSIILPTQMLWDFTVDPQGIEGVAGTVTAENHPAITNNSSYPVNVSLSMNMTGDANPYTPAGTLAAAKAALNTAGDDSILMYVQPMDGVTALGYALGTAPASLDFVLDKADYAVKNTNGVFTYEQIAGTGKHITYSLEGFVGVDSDWSDYVSYTSPLTLGISAVFTVTKATEAQKAFIGGVNTADTTMSATVGIPAYTEPKKDVTAATVTAARTITVEIENFEFTAPVTATGTTTAGASISVPLVIDNPTKITLTVPMANGVTAASPWEKLTIVNSSGEVIKLTRTGTTLANSTVTVDSVTG